MQCCIKWISVAAVEAVAEFQRFWRADPSGTMAFHFPRNILLTHAGVYFLLSFVLVSVLTVLWKERKVRQVQSGATFSLQRIESASKGQSLQQESCERSIVHACSYPNSVIQPVTFYLLQPGCLSCLCLNEQSVYTQLAWAIPPSHHLFTPLNIKHQLNFTDKANTTQKEKYAFFMLYSWAQLND